MNYSLRHLSNATLAAELKSAAAREGTSTATLVAHIAEFDRRKLYRDAAYSSMHRYCVGELRLSEQSAYRRICAARPARQFPVIFEKVADRRLHLTGLVLLAPHHTRESADQLLAACVHRTKKEIERVLAQRFPHPDLPTQVAVLAPAAIVAGIRQAIGDQPTSAAPAAVPPISAATPSPAEVPTPHHA